MYQILKYVLLFVLSNVSNKHSTEIKEIMETKTVSEKKPLQAVKSTKDKKMKKNEAFLAKKMNKNENL